MFFTGPTCSRCSRAVEDTRLSVIRPASLPWQPIHFDGVANILGYLRIMPRVLHHGKMLLGPQGVLDAVPRLATGKESSRRHIASLAPSSYNTCVLDTSQPKW